MKNTLRSLTIVVSFLIFFIRVPSGLAQLPLPENKEAKPEISISSDMGGAMIREASRVKEELQKQAESLFERDPLGWDWDTIEYLYESILSLPLKIPAITRNVMEQGRLLGVAGSLIMLIFMLAIFYSIMGHKRVMKRVAIQVKPFAEKLPERVYPYILSLIKIVVESLIPLILLGFFSLINALIAYDAAWFQLLGRVIILWTIGRVVNGLLRELLTQDLFPAASEYGDTIYRSARLILLYALIGMAGFASIEAFNIRQDALALLRFAVSISIVIVLFLLFLKKKALLSLLPQLPYKSYQWFLHIIDKYYIPLILFSFIASLLWCLGYHRLGQVVLTKIWASVGAFVVIMLIYHSLQAAVQRWSEKVDPSDEAAKLLVRSSRSGLLYATAIATVIIVLNLLGLLGPLQQLMSFGVFRLGATQVTLWILIRAAFIIFAFFYISRLLQAYLDYKIYPSLGIDEGLGYALNTFLKYATLILGFLMALKIVGIDLRFLLVFAGAIGIGIGLGLQNMAANIISGFSIIFGGKIRKGDWIETGDTLGTITDIGLGSTKVRTRDNIEYLIPNSTLISNTIVNYSLSSPMIRVEIPVGVSYDADPKAVEKILLGIAQNEPLVENFRAPAVRFVELGDNSINFLLQVWIDVQKTARKRIRSQLYYAIFDALQQAGIEIPYPQRDLHVRSNKTSNNLNAQ
jgi:small-conductance mechanosensitive channel